MVNVPVVPPASGRVVILDRYGTNVITWMNLADASVLNQLPVGTGFESNPHDYVEVSATTAWITRYGTNATPGQEPFDQGGDLLIVDTSKYTITGRIAMPEERRTIDAVLAATAAMDGCAATPLSAITALSSAWSRKSEPKTSAGSVSIGKAAARAKAAAAVGFSPRSA